MLAAPWGGGDAGLGASSVHWEMGVWVFYSPWASVNFGSSRGRMGPDSLWWGGGRRVLGAGEGSYNLRNRQTREGGSVTACPHLGLMEQSQDFASASFTGRTMIRLLF